jgi:hypothetical protein
MGKYTKEQRNKIYREAHAILVSRYEFGCYAMAMAIKAVLGEKRLPFRVLDLSRVNDADFPEFFLFRDFSRSNVHMWLGLRSEGLEPGNLPGNHIRQDVLSFCVEMTS